MVILKNNIDTSFLYNGTYEEYSEGKENYDKPTFGKEITKDVVVQNNTIIYIVAIAVPLAVVIIGIAIIVISKNKKKKASND